MSGIAWSAPACDDLVAPTRIVPLLERAIATNPDAIEPREKLGNVHFDLYDFEKALACFGAALARDPARLDTRIRFARSANLAGRHADALAATVDISAAEPELAVLGTQRGIALAALGREAEAKEAWREALVFDRTSRHPFFPLARALRRSGHHAEYLALCEEFAARGVRHAQLLLDWGRALALNGEIEKARWLLFDPARIAILPLDMPDGFNAALADEILTNPFSIRRFPHDEANRGSSRVHHLMCGAHPELPRRLIAAIQQAVDTLVTELKPRSDFDPWAQAAPSAAHLHPWGLIQRGGAYEDWHTHPGGWLSGVYYVRIPDGLSDARGCIEFGPPPSIAERAGNAIVSRRYPPAEGMLILAPSHYHHRTIPSGLDEYRVSFAFDVVPDDKPAIS